MKRSIKLKVAAGVMSLAIMVGTFVAVTPTASATQMFTYTCIFPSGMRVLTNSAYNCYRAGGVPYRNYYVGG